MKLTLSPVARRIRSEPWQESRHRADDTQCPGRRGTSTNGFQPPVSIQGEYKGRDAKHKRRDRHPARKITGTDLRFMPVAYHGLIGARCIN